MKDAWVPGALTLIFVLISSLQGVSANEGVNTCDSSSYPKGFTCCGNECCPERKPWEPKTWDPTNEPFRILFIILLVMVALLCICELMRCFCPKCLELQLDVRTGDHQIPPGPTSISALESIWVIPLDLPPSYSQVALNPTPTEPPPPYSLRSEGPAGQMRGNAYATL
ncbi:transmembrane protein 92-like [Apodemus sylvaticus]|uniref:transmembrane protein 92-like n=1 Tax=Apodemus sylvaticus TaxID=10129 RepID=UPI00224267F6|nr:transmembrane protein 92-like [Apodemus sylvaticus]